MYTALNTKIYLCLQNNFKKGNSWSQIRPTTRWEKARNQIAGEKSVFQQSGIVFILAELIKIRLKSRQTGRGEAEIKGRSFSEDRHQGWVAVMLFIKKRTRIKVHTWLLHISNAEFFSRLHWYFVPLFREHLWKIYYCCTVWKSEIHRNYVWKNIQMCTFEMTKCRNTHTGGDKTVTLAWKER